MREWVCGQDPNAGVIEHAPLVGLEHGSAGSATATIGAWRVRAIIACTAHGRPWKLSRKIAASSWPVRSARPRSSSSDRASAGSGGPPGCGNGLSK
jgi:hypothetical protein